MRTLDNDRRNPNGKGDGKRIAPKLIEFFWGGGGGALYSTRFTVALQPWWRQTVCNGNGLAWMCQRKRPSRWSGASRRTRGCSIPSFIARTYRRGRTWDACPSTIAPQTKRSCTANRAEIAPVAKLTSKNRSWKSIISSRQARGGTDHISNLQLLCPPCNKIKGNRGMEYLIAQLQL